MTCLTGGCIIKILGTGNMERRGAVFVDVDVFLCFGVFVFWRASRLAFGVMYLTISNAEREALQNTKTPKHKNTLQNHTFAA